MPDAPSTPARVVVLPVTPDTCTVNGYRYGAADPVWTGLDLARAELREASIWGEDHHLRAPWWHPDDGPPPEEPEYWYRVRPRAEGARFRRGAEGWEIVVTYCAAGAPAAEVGDG